jgi:CDP-diacylglycerol pyrophosphatase
MAFAGAARPGLAQDVIPAPGPLPGPDWTITERRGLLWQVVRGCVRAARAGAEVPADEVGRPNACARVDLRTGYVVLKDNSPAKPYAFLLLPTDRITGIEDPRLWMTGQPNYWRAAYESRGYVEKVLGIPLRRTQIGFAANSVYGRSQDQLHIHVSCIRPDVAAALARNVGNLSDKRWTLLPPLAGKAYRYRALLTDDAALARTDPVRLLARDVYPDGSMLPHTLFMAPVTLSDGRPGFAFLDGQADEDARHGRATASSERGASEELLDDSCAIAGG